MFNFTAFHFATWNNRSAEIGTEIFNFTAEIYSKTLETEDFRKLIFNGKSTDLLFLRSLVNTARSEVCYLVADFIQNLFNENEDSRRTLNDTLAKNKINVNLTTHCENNKNF